eukprot:GDKJ01041838.1.p1 GENE.GDKJ01041838.1~~GDKJ01041838.1.p1  ORF type:complete len:439 (-),score=83.55 GDKJ01041838.1:92-1408(-)
MTIAQNFVDVVQESPVVSGCLSAAVIVYSIFYWNKHSKNASVPIQPWRTLSAFLYTALNIFTSPSFTPLLTLTIFGIINYVFSVQDIQDPSRVCMNNRTPLKDILVDPYRLLLHSFFITPKLNSWLVSVSQILSLLYTSHFLQRCQGVVRASLSVMLSLPISFLLSRVAEPDACLHGPSNWIAMLLGMVFVLNHRTPLKKFWSSTISSPSIEGRWLPLIMFLPSLPLLLQQWYSEALCGIVGGLAAALLMRPDGSLSKLISAFYRNERGYMLSVWGAFLVTLGVFVLPMNTTRPVFKGNWSDFVSVLSYQWWYSFFSPSRSLSDVAISAALPLHSLFSTTDTIRNLMCLFIQSIPLLILGGLTQNWFAVRAGSLSLFLLVASLNLSSSSFNLLSSWKSFGPGMASMVSGCGLMIAGSHRRTSFFDSSKAKRSHMEKVM